MTTPRLPAFAKLLAKLMLAASITVAAAAFLSGAPHSNAAASVTTNVVSFGSVSVKMSPFQPNALARSAYNDAS